MANRPTPYTDRITAKNTEAFADMLREGASAKSYGNTYSWFIGADGQHEWAITAGWPTKDKFEVRLVKAPADEAYGFNTAFTNASAEPFTVSRDDAKPVILQQVKEMLSKFMELCGETISIPEGQYEVPADEAVPEPAEDMDEDLRSSNDDEPEI